MAEGPGGVWTSRSAARTLDLVNGPGSSVGRATDFGAWRGPVRRSLPRAATEPCGVHAAVCWDALRAAGTTTSPATANVTVGKASGLGNQQARDRCSAGPGPRD